VQARKLFLEIADPKIALITARFESSCQNLPALIDIYAVVAVRLRGRHISYQHTLKP
jgi:hypothetical protein